MNQPQPAGFEQWLQQVHGAAAASQYNENLAATIRVMAGLVDSGIQLASGPAALPYIPWLRDGMSMSTRLILHLLPAAATHKDLVAVQTDQDIRLAGHCQDSASFTADIAHHRLDLVLVGNDAALEDVQNWLQMLADTGAMVILTPLVDVPTEALCAALADECFLTDIAGAALLLTRKGNQHRLKRRGRRRR